MTDDLTFAVGQRRQFERFSRVRWETSNALIILMGLFVVVAAIGSITSGFVAGIFASRFSLSDPVLYVHLLLSYVVFFVLPLLLAIPLLLPLAAFWREPRRTIVFRRFNSPAEVAVLQRLLSRSVTMYGHVFTLADSHIRIPWGVRIPAVLGQLALAHFRPKLVDNARQLQRLQHLLSQRRWLNVNWLVSRRKIFAVRTSDEYWQRCVTMLLEHADAVLVDISMPRDSVLWEIAECTRLKMLKRMCFVVLESHEDEGKRWVAEIAREIPEVSSVPIFAYSNRGPLNAAGFNGHLTGILTRPVVAMAPYESLMLKVAATVLTSVGIAATALFLSAPYVFSGLTARYASWSWQLFQAYGYSDHPDVLGRLTADFPDVAIQRFTEYAQSKSEFWSRKGYYGLENFGDQRAIAPLLELVETPDGGFNMRGEEALRRLMESLGPSGVPPYLSALRSSEKVPFDGRLYFFLEKTLASMDRDVFWEMLEWPSEAARLTAVQRLSGENDLRLVPALLEAVNSTRSYDGPNRTEANENLRRLMSEGTGVLDIQKLDKYLANYNTAGVYAAALAFVFASMDDLRTRVRQPQPKGALLAELARHAAVPESKHAHRAREVLAVADEGWLRGLLEHPAHQEAIIDAALALAIRGNPYGLASTLELLSIEVPCGFLGSKGGTPCYRYEPKGLAVIKYLAKTLPASGRFPVSPVALETISVHAFPALVAAAARTRDDDMVKKLVIAYARHSHAYRQRAFFPSAGVSGDMAAAIPKHLGINVIQLAFGESKEPTKKAYAALTRSIVWEHCRFSFDIEDQEDVAEARRCLAKQRKWK